MPSTRHRATRTIFIVLAFVTLLAGDLWRYTLSWWGFGVIALALVVVGVVLLVRRPRGSRFGSVPIPLVVFLALATASIAWSFYPAASALGALTTVATTALAAAIAVTYSWTEVLRGLGIALRLILGLSILFELVVSLFVRQPVLPFWTDYGDGELPKLLYWSRNELFEVLDGGRIQGVVGNASTLGFLALLGLIVFGVQLASRSVTRVGGILSLALAVLTLLLTRSATITVALVVVVIVLAAALVMRRLRGPARIAFPAALLVLVGVAATLAVMFRGQVLELLGKSDDLTGRLGIWDAVIGLAAQRPVQGWGWVSYWPPWVPPFDDLITRNGVQVMHAHNAWLDTWLQLGILGVLVLGGLVVSTFARSWLFAVDAPQVSKVPGHHTAVSLLPLLLLTALLVQSVAESRLLVEYGWALLVIIAMKTRTDSVERAAG